MNRKDKKLEIFIFGVALVAVIINITQLVKLDDLTISNSQIQHINQLGNQANIGTASVSAINYNQIIGTFHG